MTNSIQINTHTQKGRQKLSIVISGIILTLTIALIYQSTTIRRQKAKLNHTEKWHEIALTDALTQIPNRFAFENKAKELDIQTKFKNPVFLVLFDIDNFKQINDLHGHLEGDRVLKICAKLLSEVFSEKEYEIFRIGGDEFAVISEGIPEYKIIDKLLAIRKKEESGLGFRISKGYAFIRNKNDFQCAFKHADEMLYADKANTD